MITENGTLESFNSFDSLLDVDLADLASVAGFELPPKGFYRLAASVEKKEEAGRASVVVTYTVLETLELANLEDTPVMVETKFSENFNLDNKYAISSLKTLLTAFSAGLGLTKVSELLDAINGVEITGVVQHRKGKKLGQDCHPIYFPGVINVTVL